MGGIYPDKRAAGVGYTSEWFVWKKIGEVGQVDVVVAREHVNLSLDQRSWKTSVTWRTGVCYGCEPYCKLKTSN